MTLLSPLALLFGLIAAVPLILHLHQNRKRIVMHFSTNRFFTQAIVRTQRRLKLRRWLLLALRMAACVLLALALSQPILAWSGLTSGQGSRDLIIILDDSLSMSASSQAGAERSAAPGSSTFAQARQLALNTIDHLVTGDRAAIVTTTSHVIATPSKAAMSGDLLSLRGRLADLQSTTSGDGDIPSALRTAAALFQQNEKGRARAALILTDGQATDWRSGQWPALPLGCTTQIVTLDPPTIANVTADHLSLATPGSAAVIHQPNAVTVRIVNHDAARRRTQLRLLVNDRAEADQPVDLPGQSAVELSLPLTFNTPGDHRLQLQLLGLHDALPADDMLFAVVHVESQLPILLVHGPLTSGQRSGAFYLQAALEAVGGKEADVKARSIPADQLTAAKLADHRVVFLCDVERLSTDAAAALRHFVAQGGGLAIFPGSHIDAAWYDANLADLLPASIGAPLVIADHPLPVVQADVTHPLLGRFSDDLRAAISGITVTQARDLLSSDNIRGRGRGWVIAQLDGDHPFIVQRSYQQGSVVLLACDTQPQSTNLPLRRLFIPFVHRLAAYLASSHAGAAAAPLAYTVGRPLTLPPAAMTFDVDHPPSAQGPDNAVVATSVIAHGAAPQLSFTPNQPGFYTLGPLTLAVNAPRSESSPAVIAASDITGDNDWHVAAVSAAKLNIDGLLAGSRSGRGYWHTLLWVVLIVILVEPLIANYSRKPAQAAGASLSAHSSVKEAA